MRKAVLLLALLCVFAATATSALADAPPPVQPHQHFLVLPDGTLLPVGPDICANPDAAQGFYGFHQNIHLGTPVQFAFKLEDNPLSFKAVFGCPA